MSLMKLEKENVSEHVCFFFCRGGCVWKFCDIFGALCTSGLVWRVCSGKGIGKSKTALSYRFMEFALSCFSEIDICDLIDQLSAQQF